MTGFAADVARVRHAWATTPADVKARRAALVGVVALGLAVTMLRSFVFARTNGWPLWGFADARPVALIVVTALLGAYAAVGGTSRRTYFLWFTLGIALVFHLEAATVHWFTDAFTGSVTGTRVDLVALAATAAAVGSVLALNGDVAATALARDLEARGVPAASADAARRGAATAAVQRAAWLAAGVTGLGLVVVVAEAVMGDASIGGALPALVAGLGVLGVVAALVLWRQRARSPIPKA